MVIKKLKSKIAIKKVKPSLKKKVVIKQGKTKKISLSSQKIRLVKVKKVISKNKKNISNKKIKILLKNKIVKNLKVKSQKKEIHIKLEKASHNPIISPSLYDWESKATFNSAAFEHNGKVHLVYRAIGDGDSSSLGYAGSYNGFKIEDRPTYFIYKRIFNSSRNIPKINYNSGGGNGYGWEGGCEDPRIVLIDGVVYMLFNAFDGWGSVRVALTSIPLEDFKKKRWNWDKVIFISPYGEKHKNWVLFPEKINDKYAILHNLHSEDLSSVLIEYVDSLNEEDFKKANFKSPDPNALPDRPCAWHRRMRSVGPPPIKTKDGWLLLYHAMDSNEPDKYKLGAMLLDLKDPTKILYRSQKPILEPEEDYENNGHKWGVVYSCGAVVKDGELFVYYGGADKFVCVASIDLEDLLEDLKKDKKVKLLKNKIIK